MARFPEPRIWTLDEIAKEAAIARDLYAIRRPTEGRNAYRVAYAEATKEVVDLLDASDDLLKFDRVLGARPSLIDAARYLDAPPISSDDLAVIAGVSTSAKTVEATVARTKVLLAGIDPDRFPWLFESPPRRPTAGERASAISGTAALMAAQRATAVLRNMWARRQEKAVATVLESRKYVPVKGRRILSMGDLPSGLFCPESSVFGQKSDVPVGLRNGRFLLVECKVSGSEVNSYKRLNHETVSKRDTWEKGFAAQAYTAAVLGGVFRPANVFDAQKRGVFIFWEHDLSPLAAFLDDVG